jgi:5-methylcytosine-specific restriction endonuclease McrA
MDTRTGTGKWKAFRRNYLSQIDPADAMCAKCDERVDLSLSGAHPMGPTLDHIIPFSVRPDLEYDETNIQLMHRRCNQSKSAAVDGVTLQDQPNYWIDGRYQATRDAKGNWLKVSIDWIGTENTLEVQNGNYRVIA